MLRNYVALERLIIGTAVFEAGDTFRVHKLRGDRMVKAGMAAPADQAGAAVPAPQAAPEPDPALEKPKKRRRKSAETEETPTSEE